MKKFLALLAVLAVCAAGFSQFYGSNDEPVPGQSRVATNAANANVRVDQKLGDFVDMSIPFKDDHGDSIKLDDLFHKRPVLLLPIFYQCAGVCTNELDQMLKSVQGFKKDDVGKSFDIVVVSIDSSETPALAANKKGFYVDYYEHQQTFMGPKPVHLGSKDGWHFLTGSEESVQKLTDEIGFRFTRDPSSKNIVHPAALLVLSPQGKISRYFLTTEYPQQLLLDSIRKAGAEGVGVRDERPFYLACIHIDPLTGQRSLNILNVLRTLCCLTVFVLVGTVGALTLKERKKKNV